MVTAIAFMMYPVTDMSRARRFYEEALGLKLARIMEEGGQAWAEYDLPGGTFAITTFVEGVHPSAEAGGSIGFEVDDVDALIAKLRARGVTVKVEPFSTPVCRMAVVLDPEGNAVTLHQVTKAW